MAQSKLRPTQEQARDDHHDFIAAASWFIHHVSSMDSTEMIAIQNGFYLLAKIGYSSLQIKPDSSNAVEALNLFLGPEIGNSF